MARARPRCLPRGLPGCVGYNPRDAEEITLPAQVNRLLILWLAFGAFLLGAGLRSAVCGGGGNCRTVAAVQGL